MATCFIIQPFDSGGPYDKRCKDILEPAIKEVGLEPYRVDEDPGTSVIIDDIEKGIREAEICLADITTNNPNIWYEVGFAYANGKPVVMICTDPRPEPFPFDVRHRHIIPYNLHSPSDFETLKSEIVKRLTAQAKKAETLQTAAAMSQMQKTEGLSPHEVAVLATVISEAAAPIDGLAVYIVKDKLKHSGFTAVAATLAVEMLSRKDMIEVYEANDSEQGYIYRACRLTPKGLDWLIENQERFGAKVEKDSPITDDDIPF
jgi:Nucleoside 2-deoxyribosyltransferase